MKKLTIPIKKLIDDSKEIHVDFSLTEEERKRMTGVLDVSNIIASYTIEGDGLIFSVYINLEADFVVLDNHNFKPTTVHVSDDADLILDTHDDENSDVHIGPDGYYDLRSSYLSLLFSMIPLGYSSVPLSKIENSDFTFISEEEYEKKKRLDNNPFKILK